MSGPSGTASDAGRLKASPAVRTPPLRTTPLARPYAPPQDPFPPGFAAADEPIKVSVRPTLWAFLPPPALLVFILSLGAFVTAVLLADAGAGDAATASAILFVLGYALSAALWARVLGRVWFLVLPVTYFLGVYIAAYLSFTASPTNSPASFLGAESGLYVALGVVVPAILGLLAWWNTFYAVTDRRALELSGFLQRNLRDLPLDRIRSVVPRPSRVYNWFGYGTVLLLATVPLGGVRFLLTPLAVRRQALGLAFYGVRSPGELAGVIEGIVRAAATQPAPAAPTTAPAAAAAGPTGPAPLCGRCKNALVWVAPERRFYCSNCRQYV